VVAEAADYLSYSSCCFVMMISGVIHSWVNSLRLSQSFFITFLDFRMFQNSSAELD